MKLNLPTHPTMRHPHTGKPLTAAGIGKRGPIWPIIGASEGDAGAEDTGGSDDSTDDGTDDDKGADDKPEEHRQATREAAKFRRELKPWRDIAKDFDLTPEQARAALASAAKPAPGSDDADTVDADEIRRQAKAEARQESDTRIIRAEVRALAAEAFNRPADALHNLDLSQYEVDDDGELVDADQVKEDLAEVLKNNPHYAKKGKGPKPDRTQGPQGAEKPDPGPGIARLRQAYADTPQ